MTRPKIVADKILKLITSGVYFSDISLVSGMAMRYRGAADHYVVMDEDKISKHELQDFALFAEPNWEMLIKNGGDFDTAFTMADSSRLRCNFYLQGEHNELAVSIRKISINVPAYETLGLSDDLKDIFYQREAGVVLVCGPTGSGKTTTQFAILKNLNDNAPMNIMTIEQPVEYKEESNMSLIVQREVPKNAATFSKALHATKRQDLDLVMIGEIRDKDTVDAMLTAAESGCLVLAGTHSKSPEDAIEAIINHYQGAEQAQKRTLLASTLIAVQSQRLLPSLDKKQKVLVYELVFNDSSIAALIRNGELSKIRNTISSSGKGDNILLNDVLAEKIKSKKISLDSAIKVSPDAKELNRKLGFS